MTQGSLFRGHYSNQFDCNDPQLLALALFIFHLVKYSNELINLSTLEGKMIFLNKAGRKMLGIDPEEVEQIHIMEVIPDHLREMVQNELLLALM
jgi:PAS domain-containing protein